jgi:hypothetical protein
MSTIELGDHAIVLINNKRRRFRVTLKRPNILIVRDSATDKRYGLVSRPDQHVDFCLINDANEIVRIQSASVPVVQVLPAKDN